jgi:predicted transcriptional regulator
MSPYKEPEAKDDFRAPLKRSDVKVLYESQLLAVIGEFEVEKVRVHDLNENEEYELTVDAVVVLE